MVLHWHIHALEVEEGDVVPIYHVSKSVEDSHSLELLCKYLVEFYVIVIELSYFGFASAEYSIPVDTSMPSRRFVYYTFSANRDSFNLKNYFLQMPTWHQYADLPLKLLSHTNPFHFVQMQNWQTDYEMMCPISAKILIESLSGFFNSFVWIVYPFPTWHHYLSRISKL